MRIKNRGRPPKFYNSDDMQKIIESYFDQFDTRLIKSNRVMPTMSGLAQALGMDRRTLLNYSKRSEFSRTVKRAKQRVEMALEKALYGKNVKGVIFNLKNNFGWK